MKAAIGKGTTLLTLAVVSSLISGCGKTPTQSSGGPLQSYGTHTASREITAKAMSKCRMWVSGSKELDEATVAVDTHKVVVQGDVVTLDGREIMQLKPECTKVEVTYEAGQLTINDGVGPVQNLRL